ncbi:MAG: oligosaccharide flippase family protein [Lachnospiraceae bacterium]
MGNKRKNSKNYLVQGTILTVAAIVAKVIGMIYRIPLTNILGDDGIGYYSTANEIYNILLMISTFSLPLAVSRLVSDRKYPGQAKNAHKVFVCAMEASQLQPVQ